MWSHIWISFVLYALALISCQLGGGERVLDIVDGGLGPGLKSIELIVLGIGLSVGFRLGIGLWSFISTRSG